MTESSKQKITILDGAMGTVLQKKGLPVGASPELLSLQNLELLKEIHRSYIEAGSQIILANTFGANAHKLKRIQAGVEEVVTSAVQAAKEAAKVRAAVGLDVGPIGELLEPLGTLSFEEAYALFAQMMKAGEKAGADLIYIETMTDLYEAKAAVLAAKENTSLPVYITMSFEENGRTFTGCTIPSMAHTLEGLGVDAIGFNCSIGPDRLAWMVEELARHTTLPIIAKPNAGLPDPVDGHYDMTAENFKNAMEACVKAGASIIGGCCGTTDEYIRLMADALRDASVQRTETEPVSFVCTPSRPLEIQGVKVIGERINPTGKKRFQQALLEQDLDYILDCAVSQEDAGADILDVNVGFPGVNEAELLPAVVKKIQSAVNLPLQLDSSSPEALEAALRVYNGKAIVNSVNGEEEVLNRILPVVKKYGAAVVGLCLDENGIPQSAAKRVEIAQRILQAALDHGIPKEDVYIDALTLTVSAQQDQAQETLKALRTIREELGLQTVLGVSNISFGLPRRPLITQTFLTAAMQAGLSLPIINPSQAEVMDAVRAYRVLNMQDEQCRGYVDQYAAAKTAASAPVSDSSSMSLEDAIIRGLKGEAGKIARQLLKEEEALQVVEKRLIPALDTVGDEYEKGTLFLPQLLSAAQAAQAVFEAVKESIAKKGGEPVKKGSLAIATVHGDIHDIGKNIVKTVLENYGYDVLDLGRDVPEETVVQAVKDHNLKLVGLSALMTTTLPAMEETIRQLKALPNPPKVFVGGAVVTPEYAKSIGADYYSKDAKQSVEIAREVLG